ncbi:hypothetical protein BH09BAC6_BH09BAC6_33720 [soil metagenome]|jgi:hypothetical protein
MIAYLFHTAYHFTRWSASSQTGLGCIGFIFKLLIYKHLIDRYCNNRVVNWLYTDNVTVDFILNYFYQKNAFFNVNPDFNLTN